MKDKSLTLASILAAGLASLCCIGPPVAVGLVGMGSFAAAASFEELRPYLLGLTALLLVGAFYLSYRKTTETECADGSCAVSPVKKRKQRALLWISTIAVVALAAFPYYSGELWSSVTSPTAMVFAAGEVEGMASTVFAVEGMTCAACAAGMKPLEREEGVTSAEVYYEKARARVRFDPAKTSVEKLIAAIAEMGYSAMLMEHGS